MHTHEKPSVLHLKVKPFSIIFIGHFYIKVRLLKSQKIHRNMFHSLYSLAVADSVGEFAVQTCFQGRFGEEMGSDEFGGAIMLHSPEPATATQPIQWVIGRLSNIEVTHAGKLLLPVSMRPVRHLGFLFRCASKLEGCSEAIGAGNYVRSSDLQ